MRDVLVASVNESYEQELAHLVAPVTLVWGALDREVPLDIATRAAALLHGHHSLRVLDTVGHFVPSDAPGELVQSVREALT